MLCITPHGFTCGMRWMWALRGTSRWHDSRMHTDCTCIRAINVEIDFGEGVTARSPPMEGEHCDGCSPYILIGPYENENKSPSAIRQEKSNAVQQSNMRALAVITQRIHLNQPSCQYRHSQHSGPTRINIHLRKTRQLSRLHSRHLQM